jgi:DNA-binding MarR family transcriptional regulator
MSSGSADDGPYVGAMLRMVWQWVREQIFSGVVEAGYDDVNPAHVALFRYPGLDGLRPTELAAQLQITKQSVNDLVRHLEARGYLVRTPDSSDGRARVVQLTTKGHRLERTVTRQSHQAELRIAEMLGTRRFAALRHALETLARSVAHDDLASSTTE